jgi:hypothetical protein
MKPKETGWIISAFIPILGLILGQNQFSGPYLMIATFIISLLIGIYCVKRVCLDKRAFKSLMHEVRVVRRKLQDNSYESSDGFSGDSNSGEKSTGDNSDVKSESGLSSYSASDAASVVNFDNQAQIDKLNRQI